MLTIIDTGGRDRQPRDSVRCVKQRRTLYEVLSELRV